MPKRDIVERLRDSTIDASYRDRLIAAKEIERLRKVMHDAGSAEDPLSIARRKMEEQANRIDELEAEVDRLRAAEAAMRKRAAAVADQAYENARNSSHLHHCRDAVAGYADIIAAMIRSLPLEGE
jgi:hypothetical protein